MKMVVRICAGLALVVVGIIAGKKLVYRRKHGTPPGTYEVNMEDWNE